MTTVLSALPCATRSEIFSTGGLGDDFTEIGPRIA